MKILVSFLLALGISLSAVSTAYARDTKYLLPIEDAMQIQDKNNKLDGSVKFYFGNMRHPVVLKKLGVGVSNSKTNSFGKSDEKACNWVFLSALVDLQQQATSIGANAVVNITSYYKKNVMSSNTQFECHAGGVVAGVALKGDLVKIAGKK